MAWLPVISLSGKTVTLSSEVSFCSFVSPVGAYIELITVILGPIQVLTISGNEPISGQASGYPKVCCSLLIVTLSGVCEDCVPNKFGQGPHGVIQALYEM